MDSFLKSGSNKDCEYQFRISPAEHEILQQFHNNIILLGRSGTGKTSCAILKMWMQYNKEPSHSIGNRQVFFSVSSNLSNHAKKYFRGLQKSHQKEITRGTAEIIHFKDIPNTDFPLFLTYSQFIEYLDASLPRPFFSVQEEKIEQTTTVNHPKKRNLSDNSLGWEELEEDADLDKSAFRKNDSKIIINYSYFVQNIWREIIKSKS